MSESAEFDSFATDYDAALNEGLSVSGEDKNYFARGRLVWLRRCLDRLGVRAGRVMDFGCGTGSATPFVMEDLGADYLLGTEVSAKSLEVARKEHGAAGRVEFRLMGEYVPDGSFDVVFCNGVFHHIPLDQRAGCVEYIHKSLRPGGWFAMFENNPWNPGTRYVMSKIPFDRDAITLSPPTGRRLMRDGGFGVERSDFLFYFPKSLKFMRPLEMLLYKVPMGTQYLVLGRKAT